MNVEWLNAEKKNSAVTIYNNNITLSKKAASFFEDACGVIVGIDKDTNALVIKKVTRGDEKNSESKNLLKVDMKTSYGRINSRKLIEEISKTIDLNFTIQPSYKFDAKWNTGYKMLIVNTKGGSKDVK